MEEWEKIKLKEVLTEITERNKGEKVKLVLSVTNSQGFVSQEEYFEGTVHSQDISNYKIVRKNQFAYNPSRINVGSIDILKKYEEGALSPMYVVFKVDENRLLSEYFKYFFQTHRFEENVKNNTQGSVRNSLSFKSLADFEYYLPPLKEQERIVKILEKVDLIIKKYESLLEEKNQFIKSQFVEMFGDINSSKFKIDKIDNVVKLTQGVQIPQSEQYGNYNDGLIRYLYIGDLKYEDNNAIYVKDLYKEKIIGKKDLAVVNTGNTSGEVYYGKEGVLSNNLFKISFKEEEFKIEYLYYYLSSKDFQTVLWRQMKEGSQPHLGHKIYGNMKIIIPDISSQNKFIKVSSLIDKQKFTLEKIIENYNNLKKGLMQQLLTGKIKVKI